MNCSSLYIQQRRKILFIINGIVATAIHYAGLIVLIELVHFKSAGVANFLAAAFAISASFLGNRIFVFNNKISSIFRQFSKFILLYGALAVFNGVSLYIWSDRLLYDYRLGFVLTLIIQTICSYFGNKYFVFKKK